MRLEEIRQRCTDEFMLINVTKADNDKVEVLEGTILAHSLNRDEIIAFPGHELERDVVVE